MSQVPPPQRRTVASSSHQAVEDRERAADAFAQRAGKLAPGRLVGPIGNGSIACVYIYVGKDADLPAVAKDIRNQGATIVLMNCENKKVAAIMARLLSEAGIAKKPLVKGEVPTRHPW